MKYRNENKNTRRSKGNTSPKSISEREVYKNAPSRFRKKRGRINMAVVLVTVLLTAALAASAVQIVRISGNAESDRREQIEEAIGSEKETVSEANKVDTESFTVSASDVYTGNLILVNYENEYVFPEDESALVSVYQSKTEDYSVAYPDFLLDDEVLAAFNSFAAELADTTGESCLLINSTYRSYEEQQETYEYFLNENGEEYAKEYVADPGKSEHHTGLALDLTIRFADGTYQRMADYEHYDVINTLCVEYGFIHRYPANKEAETHISNEPWHYRYVGVPHSYVISKERYCLEEYIEALKEYTLSGKLLCIDADGEIGECDMNTLPEAGYVIYYVPAAAAETVIEYPAESDEYSVSGNNSDGFVVAVRFGEVTLPETSFTIVS